jgi:rSAM/selenodomain-associated transferase 2
MTRISDHSIAVIVPTLNEAKAISVLLHQLAQDGFAEIVVADSASTDGTIEIVKTCPRARLVPAPRGRGAAMREGVTQTKSDYIFLLHADSALPAGAAGLIRTALADPTVAGGCFRLRFDQDTSLLRLYPWLSRFDSPITTFGDQGYFMHRAALQDAGGVPDLPIREDVELRRRLKTQGQFVKLSSEIVTSARRFQKSGIIAGQSRNAILLAGYYLGVRPDWLSRFYPPNSDREDGIRS